MLPYPVVQIAYFVNDSQASALEMVKRFGAGPFFFVPRIELSAGEVQGKPQKFLHSSAYGQWGNVMMELVQQDEEGPSPFRMMYAPGEEGIHHTAMMVDSMEETYAECEGLGLSIASKAFSLTGTEFAFIDTVQQMGHMIEIYEKDERLLGFYEMIRSASVGWDGSDPVRSLE
ncbi:MAG: VOC family protein [Pseudomonadales bacterium]|nr:VOC family protein [Pseudomonadales bacterium]MBO6566304.1 VOC family protein [Pseudomonadales bacterium]MBO6594896.1 VOC family protein [Pseudomonadales bacterium]MBO6701402.1 VOC family protein [Pseudomonadales bacterium]MBO6821544.1 VOC family protein [Pseudomonadales bacterium]